MSEPVIGDVVTTTIKVAGSVIPDTYSVLSIVIEKAVNRIAFAEIVLLDGSNSEESFTISSSQTFVPGNEVIIEAGYNNNNSVVFKGLVTGQNLRVDDEVGSALTVTCKDAAVKMTIGRNSEVFNNQKDSAVISTLIGNHSGVSADVTQTETQWPQMVQYYATDWDFMLCRAEVNAMVVTTINGTVSVFKPGSDSSAVLTVTYGETLYEFDGDLDAMTQLKSVKAQAWDPSQQSVIDGSASNSYAGPGDLSSSKLAEVSGVSEFNLQTSAPEQQGDLSQWAEGQMTKRDYAKITAKVRFQGDAIVEPGKYITLEGLGDRFNGDYFVACVCHEISAGNWFINAHLGLSPQWFAQEPDVMAPPAAGLLPGIQGLYNATVKQIYDDPDNAYRILIDVPLLKSSGQGLWARLTNFYSTDGQGVFFLPEVGDEVIVGFTNDDPRYPVILGSVYSTKRKPFSELTPNEQNSKKAIVTKSELRVVFDDENKVLTITTPGNNMMEFSDKDKQITVKDENGNSMVMSESGIEIKSPKSITISADDKVSISGKMGVSIEASGGDVKTSGININQSATANYEASGGAMSTVKGGATLTLKGAMVMIN